LGTPLLGLVSSNLVLLAWQLPGVVALTTRNLLVDDTAVLVFLASATAFWLPVVQGDRLSQISRAGYLLVAGVPPTLPGVVLAFSRRLYYGSSLAGPPVFNLPPLKDQHLAGLLLFGTAKLVLVTAVFVVIWNMLGGEREPPDDRRGYEDAPVLPPSAPAWYWRLDDELAPEPAAVELRPVATGRPSESGGPDKRLAPLSGGPAAGLPAPR
jgi:cytochrome c oxidase assembly factor CtaG